MKIRNVLCVAAAVALLLACGSEESRDEVGAHPVVIDTVQMRDLEERIEATGELLAKEQAAIASEVSGRITEILVDEGDAVAAQQVLLEIDPERRNLELADARAGLAEAEATRREQEREYARRKTLHERGIASDADLDQAVTDLALARSRADAAAARVGVAERAVRDASVRAPFSGLVARRTVSRGEFVNVGQPLFELVALDPVEVEFHLAERDSARAVVGQEVRVSVAPFPEEHFRGVVTVVSPTIDPRTRTLRVKAEIDNTDGRLRPGLFARADLGVAVRRNILLVPEQAILLRSDGAVVYRSREGNRVERVIVETGEHRGGEVEVASGLAAGDLVVTRGQGGLVDGALVSPRNPDGSPLSTAVSAVGDGAEALP
jgi:membrane fusion protein (multidrug efflux system)